MLSLLASPSISVHHSLCDRNGNPTHALIDGPTETIVVKRMDLPHGAGNAISVDFDQNGLSITKWLSVEMAEALTNQLARATNLHRDMFPAQQVAA